MTAEDKCQVLKDVIALTRKHHTVYMQERIYAVKLDDGAFLTEAKSETDAREKLARLIRQDTDDYQTKNGEWIEKEVMHKDEAHDVIDEWQSARCSVCGKYHTTPYMYYFDEHRYCPNCGADMRGES